MPRNIDPALSRESGTYSDEFYASLRDFLTVRQSAENLEKCRSIGLRYGETLDAEIDNLRLLANSPEVHDAIERALEYRRLLDQQLDGLPHTLHPRNPAVAKNGPVSSSGTAHQ